MRIRFPFLALLSALPLAFAAPANAAFFPATTVDGPSADIVRFGDADLARDGDGALTYVKKEGGVDHIFVSLVIDGVPQAGQRVDTGQAGASSFPSVGVANGGLVVVTWVNGNNVYGADRAGGAFSAPKIIHGDNAGQYADTDMGPNGVAYTTYVTKVGAEYDARASRLENGTWTPVGDAYPGPIGKLEGTAAKDVGAQPETRPRVAVDGAGNAVVAFAEGDVGVDQLLVQVRRLAGTTVGSLNTASVATLGAAPRANTAWMVDVDVDDAGNASVAFREDFTYGGTDKARALVRRLVGTTFSDPVVFDGLPTPPDNGAEQPRVDVNGAGQGLAATRRQMAPFNVFGAALQGGAWAAFGRVNTPDLALVPEPVAAISGVGPGLLAWKSGTTMVARYGAGPNLFGETTLSDPALGDVEAAGTHEAAADFFGDAIVGFTQGTAATRRIVMAGFDLPPTAPTGTTTEGYTAERRPTLRWAPAADVWGPVGYRVEMGGRTVGMTSGTSFQLVDSLPDGTHAWRVVAIDGRGQEAPSAFRAYRLDLKKPSVTLTIKGKRRVGSKGTFSIRYSDGRGSGVKSIKFAVTGGNTGTSTRITRTFRKKGKVNVSVTVKDAVGNATTIKRTINVVAAKKKKKKK